MQVPKMQNNPSRLPTSNLRRQISSGAKANATKRLVNLHGRISDVAIMEKLL